MLSFSRSLVQQKLLFAVTVALIAAMAAGITVGAVLGSGSSSPPVSIEPAPSSATLSVTNLNDAGAGSLRQAIFDAAAGDTIEFAVTGDIILTSGHLVIDKNLTINGPGPDNLNIDGNNASRVFLITNTSGNSMISGVTVRNGAASPDGGGILIQAAGRLTLSTTRVQANTATASGGGIFNLGTLTADGTTFQHNLAQIQGGAIDNSGSGMAYLTNVTVSDNTGDDAGGGIRNNAAATMTVVNSTITGNSANLSGGGGIFDTGTLQVVNTIVAGNTAALNSPDCNQITSLGRNLIGTSDGCTLTPITGDLVGVDPLLGPLQENGGPTLTHALLSGSPAIDAGDIASCPATDQRGVLRPQGPDCDIGAYEFESEPLPEQDIFVYSIKTVCVPHLGNAYPALMPGKYRTAVNVHNPWDEPATIEKSIILSNPQGVPPITGDIINEVLPSRWSFDVDCPHMRDDFGLPQGAKVPGGKGFMTIKSDQKIKVVAVYTSRTETKTKDGVGTSIDVEYIEPDMTTGTIP